MVICCRVIQVPGQSQRNKWNHDHKGPFGLCNKDPYYRKVDGKPATPLWTELNNFGCRYIKSKNYFRMYWLLFDFKNRLSFINSCFIGFTTCEDIGDYKFDGYEWGISNELETIMNDGRSDWVLFHFILPIEIVNKILSS